jgi:hypothetical protein
MKKPSVVAEFAAAGLTDHFWEQEKLPGLIG